MNTPAPISMKTDEPLLSDHDITNGWHTVFAIRYPDVNAAIVKAGSSPPDYEQEETSGTRTAGISGPFGDWQLTIGGDGKNLRMALPSAALLYEDTTQPSPKTFNDVTFVIEVELEFLPQPDQPENSDAGTWYDLVLDTKSLAKNRVAVFDLLYAGTDMDNLTKNTLMGLMADWLNDNSKDFTQVFASVNLNAKADVDDFQWMVPTHVSYASTDRGTIESSIFAVLCMTQHVEPTGLAHQVSVDAIPEGQDTAFLISRERFMSQMVLPGIGTLFSDPQESGQVWPDDYFEMSSNNTIIQNSRKVHIDEMDFSKKGDGSDTYRADIEARKFKVELHEDYMSINYIDLYHSYRHVAYVYDVFHTFGTNVTASVNESGVFSLVPLSTKISKDQEFIDHHIVVKPTELTKWVEIGILAASLFGCLYSLKGVQWAEVRGAALAEDGAVLAGEGAALTEGLTEAELAATQAEGAVATRTMLQEGWLVGKAWFQAAKSAMLGNLLVRICGGILALDRILQLIADGDSQGELPQFEAFAAQVMGPVQWPDASDYKVNSVTFNDCLQVVGDAGFTHKKV